MFDKKLNMRGRPKQDNTKNIQLGVRANQAQKDLLENYCKIKNLSMSDFLLQSGLEKASRELLGIQQ